MCEEEHKEQAADDGDEQEMDVEELGQEVSGVAARILRESIYPQITPALREIDLSIVRAVQQQADVARQIQQSISPVASMFEARNRAMFDSLSSVQRMIDSINFTKQLNGIQTLLDAFAVQVRIAHLLPTQTISRIETVTSGLSSLIGDFPALRLPALVWNSNMSQVLEALAGIDQIVRHQVLIERMLEPYVVMGQFIQATGERLEQAETDAIKYALEGSLLLAQKQSIASTSFLKDALKPPQGRQRIIPQPPLNSLTVQQEELVKSEQVPANPDYETLLLLSPAARLQKQMGQVLLLVTACNEAHKLLNPSDEDVFKPTNRVLASYARLPFVAVVDYTTLGSVIDGLFFIFYEGAGDDNLRFLRYLGDEECRAIWALKHLRNLFYRHDPEHGTPAKIRKAWVELRKDFDWLGVRNVPPQTRDDYQFIQQRLLNELEEFLSRLQAAINAHRSPQPPESTL